VDITRWFESRSEFEKWIRENGRLSFEGSIIYYHRGNKRFEVQVGRWAVQHDGLVRCDVNPLLDDVLNADAMIKHMGRSR